MTTQHKIPANIIGGQVYHKPDGRGYAYGSTMQTLLHVYATPNLDAVDVDRRVDADHNGWWAHQANPTKNDAWFDPTGKINDRHAFLKLHSEQVGKLRFKSPNGTVYWIQDDDTYLKRCALLGIIACIEAKTTRSKEHYEKLKAKAEKHGATIIIMSLGGSGKAGENRLRGAHEAGLVTMWLWRKGDDARIPDFVDLVKSKPGGKTIDRVSKRPIGPAVVKPKKVPAALLPKPKPAPATPAVTGTDVQRLIKLLRAEVGYREGRDNLNRYAPMVGHANNQAWCATFVCAMFKKAGLENLIKTPSAGVDQLSVGFKRDNRWSEYPAIGAVMFRGVPSDLSHTGVVVDYDDTFAYTIEGNTNDTGARLGDGVYALKRTRRDDRLVGYGYPKFKEGIKSADPAFQPGPKPGAKRTWVDYSFSRPSASALKAAGFTTVVRYISRGSKKNITESEIESLRKAGLNIALVWETTAGRAADGQKAGVDDVKDGERIADQLGYPKDAVIFYAVDFDASPSQVRPYFRGVKNNARRPYGVYGGFKIADAGLAPHVWQTMAWSSGRVSDKTDLLQHLDKVKKVRGSQPSSWDENTKFRTIPVWMANQSKRVFI